jgi:hypothetical protein
VAELNLYKLSRSKVYADICVVALFHVRSCQKNGTAYVYKSLSGAPTTLMTPGNSAY